MKKFTLAAIVSGLLVTGVAFAAEPPQKFCEGCLCSSQSTEGERSGAIFKPLFPEFEVQPPMGG